MGDKVSLSVEERHEHGKKVIKLRRAGLVPGVVYGQGVEPVSIQVVAGELSKIVQSAGKHTPIHLSVGSKKHIAMIKDVDFSTTGVGIRHISFHAVQQNKPITAEVPIHLVGEGESEAERAGLVILQNLDEIEVRALPMDLPEALEADVRSLKVAGEKILVGDLKLPTGVELVEHGTGREDNEDEEQQHITDLQVASVWEPSALASANDAAAGEATAETEVVVEGEAAKAE